MTEKCKKCGSTDFNPSGKCRPCCAKQNAAYAAKRRGSYAVKAKAKDAKPAEVSVTPAAVLEIQQGYGLKAWIDEPYLFIEQHDGEGQSDTVCLSKFEARRVFEEFEEWAS